MSENKSKITVPITKNLYLVYRVNQMSKSVILVKRIEPGPDLLVGFEETEQMVIASTAAGCSALANALKEMEYKIREGKRKERFKPSGVKCPSCQTELISDLNESTRFCSDCNYREND